MISVPFWLFLTTLVIVPILLALTFIAGYETGIWRFRGTQNKLAKKYSELAANLAELGDQMNNDLFRAGIDQGRTYIIDRVTTLIEQLQAEIAPTQGT